MYQCIVRRSLCLEVGESVSALPCTQVHDPGDGIRQAMPVVGFFVELSSAWPRE